VPLNPHDKEIIEGSIDEEIWCDIPHPRMENSYVPPTTSITLKPD
jgi:hypothetical protein